MALYVAWLSLGACGLLSAVCLLLYLDGKGQRRTIAALESRIAGLSRDLATLSGSIELYDVEPQRHAVLPAPPRAPFEIYADERLTVEVPALGAPPSGGDDEPEARGSRSRVFIGMTLPFPAPAPPGERPGRPR